VGVLEHRRPLRGHRGSHLPHRLLVRRLPRRDTEAVRGHERGRGRKRLHASAAPRGPLDPHYNLPQHGRRPRLRPRLLRPVPELQGRHD
jgi:hypothetical protein